VDEEAKTNGLEANHGGLSRKIHSSEQSVPHRFRRPIYIRHLFLDTLTDAAPDLVSEIACEHALIRHAIPRIPKRFN
jgi:hypothetical protein